MSVMAPLQTTPTKSKAAQTPLASTVLQQKIALSTNNDPFEREADRVADQVLAASAHGSVNNGAACSPPLVEKPASKKGVGSEKAGHSILGTGRPLDAPLRTDLEQRFGHDFSRVRVHTDGTAIRHAQALGAQAFTHGTNIVFDAGEFTPHTRAGRNLLAHELAHVLQQSRAGVQIRPMLRPGDKQDTRAVPTTSTPPDPMAAAREALTRLRQQATAFATTPPTSLAATLQQLRTSVNDALRVATVDASQATLVADLRNAYNDAVRAALTASTSARPGAIRTPPTLQELYERHRNDIEPFALPAATTESTAQELSAEIDRPLPAGAAADQRRRHTALATARRQMRVVTSQVSLGLENLFSTTVAAMTRPLPPHATVRFSSGVPATLQRGLRNVAGSILDTPLSANTTVMLALDLRNYGGGYDAYRFTRLDLGTTAAPAIEILVELQGSIGIEGLLTQQRIDLQARFTRVGFRRGGGFSDTEFEQVLIGAGEIPESQLSPLGALNFVREAASTERPDAAADYEQTTHTVHVYDHAYGSGIARMGRAGRVLQFAAHSVAHEIGHARDLSSLRTTAAAATAAEDALVAEYGTGGGGYSIPDRRDPARARFDELNAPLTAAQAAERAARSRSGARWAQDTGTGISSVVDALPARERTPAFRAATARDDGPGSPRMPTTYPHPESVLQEYYAESFALYRTSPDLLRRIRPNVYAYFVAESR